MNPWRRGAGKCKVREKIDEIEDCEALCSDLYGQEQCYYGESLVLAGEAMSQLGDMRSVIKEEIRNSDILRLSPGVICLRKSAFSFPYIICNKLTVFCVSIMNQQTKLILD